jgi:hypothetical protein
MFVFIGSNRKKLHPNPEKIVRKSKKILEWRLGRNGPKITSPKSGENPEKFQKGGFAETARFE